MTSPTTTSANSKSVLQIYLALPRRTRRVFGLCGLGFAIAGIYASSWLEERYPANPPIRLISPEEVASVTESVPSPSKHSDVK